MKDMQAREMITRLEEEIAGMRLQQEKLAGSAESLEQVVTAENHALHEQLQSMMLEHNGLRVDLNILRESLMQQVHTVTQLITGLKNVMGGFTITPMSNTQPVPVSGRQARRSINRNAKRAM